MVEDSCIRSESCRKRKEKEGPLLFLNFGSPSDGQQLKYGHFRLAMAWRLLLEGGSLLGTPVAVRVLSHF